MDSSKSNDKNDKKVVRPLTSVHVVHYACTNCGEEEEDVQLCSACKAPSRVIKVTELYGEEATEYLETLKKEPAKEASGIQSEQYDDSILGVGGEEVVGEGAVDNVALGEIFPESEDSKDKNYVEDLGDDFESALDILDQEDDDEDLEDLPEL